MLRNLLHFAVLFQLGFGMGVKEKERRMPEIKEEDPDMHTVFIHSDSKEAQERYFDWKEEDGELDNWKIPRIISTLEEKDQNEGVKKMLGKVDGRKEPQFYGRFTNQEAVVHVLDNPVDPNDDKLDGEIKENQIEHEHDAGQDEKVEIDTSDEEMKEATQSKGTEDATADYNVGVDRLLISQLETEETIPTSIHAASNEALQNFFDLAEESGALANMKNPVIISSGSKLLKNDNKFRPLSSTKFTNSQRLWMLKGKADDEFETFSDYRNYANRFGTMNEVFIPSYAELENWELDLLNLISQEFSTATFILKQEKLYTIHRKTEIEFKLFPLHNSKYENLKKQWKKIQMQNLKQFDINIDQYVRSDKHKQSVMKGYWKETCENLDWALNVKLNTNQNLALVCLLHDIRKRRFKYEVPSNVDEEDCTKNPSNSNCQQEGKSDFAFNLHLEDGTGFTKEKYKNESDIYLFFPGAGSFEPVEVAYFEVEPEKEAVRFSALGEFLQPLAFIALVLFGIFFTVFVKCVSQAEKAEIFLFIVGGIFEQGYPFLCNVRRRTSGVLWRGFLGMRIICFLWLLAWFFFRQYLSGSLIASLSSKYTPQGTQNHSKLVDFLGKKGAPLVQPMRTDEEDWVRNSYLRLVEKFPYLSKENKLKYPKPPTDRFPEMDLLECVLSKDLTGERKDFCKEFHAVMGKSFAYTSTKQRLKTIKKMAQLINPDVYVYEKNVETPFMKPNFISTYDKRISTLLWNDILYITESGIWEKWQKLDSELEALTDCVNFVRRIRKVEDSEAKRICQQVLRAPRPSATERAFGKFEPISMRVISIPMIFFALSLGGCCIIFAFEMGFFAWLKVYLAVKIWIWCLTFLRFTVRCKILYRSLKECDRKDLMRMISWTNIYKFLANRVRSASDRVCNKMRNMASGMRQVLGHLRQFRFRPWARRQTQVIELETVSTNTNEIDENPSGIPVMETTNMESEPESNQLVQEEERVAFLLEMIEKYDILQFPEEDMELLRKSKVIITPEEAEELMSGFRPDEDEVQEFPNRPEMRAREAWVEVNDQGGEESQLEEPTQSGGLQEELGESDNFPRAGCSKDWDLEF